MTGDTQPRDGGACAIHKRKSRAGHQRCGGNLVRRVRHEGVPGLACDIAVRSHANLLHATFGASGKGCRCHAVVTEESQVSLRDELD